MTLVFYITSHGFGHASRSLEVAAALHARRPDVRVVVRSAAPRWFLEASARSPIEIQQTETDTGIVQIDSLRLDEDESARRAAAFYSTFSQRARDEAEVLRSLGAMLVVGDIPPLAFAAAHQAGIPSIAIGNFTWDWIYDGYPQFERIAPGVIATIREAYANTTLALRLPFHGGFDTMPVVRDVPLVARHASRTRASVREMLNLPSGQAVVLASFGGHRLQMPYADIAKAANLTLLLTDFEAGFAGESGDIPHLKLFTAASLSDAGLRYADLVAASDVVISKLGYGIVSECIANGAALLYTPRGRFREVEVFEAEVPAVLRCRQMPQDDFLAGRWSASIEALIRQPPLPQLPTNGAEMAADAIVQFIRPT